jgi:hypothetical protein
MRMWRWTKGDWDPRARCSRSWAAVWPRRFSPEIKACSEQVVAARLHTPARVLRNRNYSDLSKLWISVCACGCERYCVSKRSSTRATDANPLLPTPPCSAFRASRLPWLSCSSNQNAGDDALGRMYHPHGEENVSKADAQRAVSAGVHAWSAFLLRERADQARQWVG